MLNSFRRGSASVAKPLRLTLTPPRIRPFQATRPQQLNRLSFQSPSSLRTFVSSTQWQQYASQATAFKEDDFDTALEQGNDAQKAPSADQASRPTKEVPVMRFEDLSKTNLVCDTLVKTITQDMRLETMTEVQSLTIKESLLGADILAQARTGTGKTLAFLVPTLQNIINFDSSLERRGGAGGRSTATDIRALVISPTRELAEQIAVEARKLTRNTGIVVQTAVGGSSKSAGLRAIRSQGCHLLVGTPGRLKDLLSDPYSGLRAPNLSAFVLDEADRLLDQGFAPDIQEIQTLLPNRRDVDRQTLLYSATVPREVMQIVKQTMKPDFKFIRTVQEGEAQTHEKVVQKMVQVGGLENLMPTLVELCQRELVKNGNSPFKAIVYFSANSEVQLASSIMNNLTRSGGFDTNPLAQARIIEMHGRLTQEQRTRAADGFKKASAAIMLSSDVTARGMDFPNVTHVIQMGLPPSAEQYVHRIGRTARAGREGEGWLLINSLETREARFKLKSFKIEKDESLETAKVDMSREAQLPEHAARILTQVGEATSLVPKFLKSKAYMANLGMYSWVANKQQMVDAINGRAKFGWGMTQMPSVHPTLASKLGLKRVQGIQIGYEELEGEDDSRGGRSERGGRGGGSFRSDRNRWDNGGFARSGGRDRNDRGGFSRSDGDRGGFSRSGGDRQGFSRSGRNDREDRGGYGRREGSGYGDRERGGDRGASRGAERYEGWN